MPNITYGLLCKHLLEKGVDSKIIIKHRFAVGFIAKAARAMPDVVDDRANWFEMEFIVADRKLSFRFNRLSNVSALIDQEFDGQIWRPILCDRPTEKRINECFKWLYPSLPWYVRVWEWVQEKLRWHQ